MAYRNTICSFKGEEGVTFLNFANRLSYRAQDSTEGFNAFAQNSAQALMGRLANPRSRILVSDCKCLLVNLPTAISSPAVSNRANQATLNMLRTLQRQVSAYINKRTPRANFGFGLNPPQRQGLRRFVRQKPLRQIKLKPLRPQPKNLFRNPPRAGRGAVKFPPYLPAGQQHPAQPNIGVYGGAQPAAIPRGYPAPQYPAPQYPAPQYPAPQYPAPQYPAPQYPAMQYPAGNIHQAYNGQRGWQAPGPYQAGPNANPY